MTGLKLLILAGCTSLGCAYFIHYALNDRQHEEGIYGRNTKFLGVGSDCDLLIQIGRNGKQRLPDSGSPAKPILVAGATGYVGGRLIPALLEKGYRVRALGRSLDKLGCRPWAHHPQIELFQGDVLELESLKKAASGCRAAYYLVHSMIAQKERFVEADRRAARNMVQASASAGLERMIYLGGLAEARRGSLSKHLQSRIEVAGILQSGPVPTTDLRTPMILGSGSASFEILRYLVERLPVMITPRWVRSLNQPIAIRDVIGYLTGCLAHAKPSEKPSISAAPMCSPTRTCWISMPKKPIFANG